MSVIPGLSARQVRVGARLAAVTFSAFAAAASAQAGWYNPSWANRKPITLDGSLVPANQTNFPVLVSWTADTDLAAGARADGYDILFVGRRHHQAQPRDRALHEGYRRAGRASPCS